jgi:peptidoglycan/xylan/chitin deacetylase (PgdA/CDA1 family)
MERYPHLVEAILKDGHEIAQHGYIHEDMNTLPGRVAEVEWIGRVVEVIDRMTGNKPRGLRAAPPIYLFSRYTASVLAELDFVYDTLVTDDDVPSIYETDKGDITGLPLHWGMDDWPQYVRIILSIFAFPKRPPRVT